MGVGAAGLADGVVVVGLLVWLPSSWENMLFMLARPGTGAVGLADGADWVVGAGV